MNVTAKIILGVAVIAVLFVGVGYALVYTGSTTVTDNTIDSKFITVTTKNNTTPDYNDFLDSVDYNTVNDEGTILYSPILTDKIVGTEPANNAQKISTADWKVAVEKGGTFASEQTYNMDVTVSNFSPVAGLTYTLKIGTQTATYTAEKWSFSGLTTSSTPLDVTLFVSGTATASNQYAGFASDGSSDFTFTAQVTTP